MEKADDVKMFIHSFICSEWQVQSTVCIIW